MCSGRDFATGNYCLSFGSIIEVKIWTFWQSQTFRAHLGSRKPSFLTTRVDAGCIFGPSEGGRTHPVAILLLKMVSLGVTTHLALAWVFLDKQATIAVVGCPENLQSGLIATANFCRFWYFRGGKNSPNDPNYYWKVLLSAQGCQIIALESRSHLGNSHLHMGPHPPHRVLYAP